MIDIDKEGFGLEIDSETKIKLSAGNVWTICGDNASKEKIEHWCEVYGISYEQAMKFKSYWLNLQAQSPSFKKQNK